MYYNDVIDDIPFHYYNIFVLQFAPPNNSQIKHYLKG